MAIMGIMPYAAIVVSNQLVHLHGLIRSYKVRYEVTEPSVVPLTHFMTPYERIRKQRHIWGNTVRICLKAYFRITRLYLYLKRYKGILVSSSFLQHLIIIFC